MSQHETPTTTPQATNAQASHYWKQVADFISAVVKMADQYLPDDADALDDDSKQEIYSALVQARVVADTAYGAYTRVSEAERAQAAERAAAHHQHQMAHPQPVARDYAAPQQAPAPQGW